MYATHWDKFIEAALFSSFVGSQFRPIRSILSASSDFLLIFPLSTLFDHLSDPITFAHTHTTLKIKARGGSQHTHPNINFQERLQVVQHPDTHTFNVLVRISRRAERDHVIYLFKFSLLLLLCNLSR